MNLTEQERKRHIHILDRAQESAAQRAQRQAERHKSALVRKMQQSLAHDRRLEKLKASEARRKAMAAYRDDGHTYKKIGEIFGVSGAAARRALMLNRKA